MTEYIVRPGAVSHIRHPDHALFPSDGRWHATWCGSGRSAEVIGDLSDQKPDGRVCRNCERMAAKTGERNG